MIIDKEPRHSIGVVVRETGLTAEVVRVWERRYGAVSPSRTNGGHRLYSEADISRLTLLRRATQSGHRIGNVVQLPTDWLHELVSRDADAESKGSAGTPAESAAVPSGDSSRRLSVCMEAVRSLNEVALQRQLESALVEFGLLRFMEQMVEPLMVQVGEQWEHGHIRPFHEHMASVVVRAILYSQHINKTRNTSAPAIVVTTPPGQLHELGALAAALTAEAVGWRAIYLGPDLPIEEIAMGARQTNACAVALSVTTASERTLIAQDFQKLARLLGRDVVLIAGGCSAVSFGDAIAAAGLRTVESLPAFRVALREMPSIPKTATASD